MPIQLIGPLDIVIPEKPQKTKEYAEKFRDAVTPYIAEIDALIRAYNQLEDEAARINALSELEATVDKIDRKFPDDLKRFFMDYHIKIHKTLFNDIQDEREALGMVPDISKLTFPEYLAVMAPDKVERLLAVLLEPGFTQEKLAERVFDEGEMGREDFLKLLSRYEIGVLGGGNSKNFTVLDTHTFQTIVLKAENRMGVAKEAVRELREGCMQDVFTPDISEREAVCTNPETGKHVTRTLLFTEFHPGGDLKKTAKPSEDPDARIDSAMHLYIQMARILENMERAGYCFTDMKNGNWLVDEYGELRIADKKGFTYTRETEVEVIDRWGDVSTQTVRVLDLDAPQNTFYPLLRSKQLETPELARCSETRELVDVSKMHAYMLGKNLYQNLTGCSDSAFYTYDKDGNPNGTLHDVDKFDFSAPVFKTPKGANLAYTIKQLIYTSADDAPMSLHEAVDALAFLQYPELVEFSFEHEALVELKTDVYQLLNLVQRLDVGASEKAAMQTFIAEQQQLIAAADTEEALCSIHDTLNEKLGNAKATAEAARDALLEAKVDTHQQLKGIEHFKLGDKDGVMQAFITDRTHALNKAQTTEDVMRIQDEVRAVRTHFKDNEAQLAALKDMIALYKADASPKVAQKWEEIEAKVLALPLLERTSVMEGKTPAQKAVLNDMGQEVVLFKRLSQSAPNMLRRPSLLASPDVQAFMAFKEKYGQQTPRPEVDTQHDSNIRPPS
ncbi:MAG: hypothetical protein P1U32_02995 [Legionellaceae bacterium]|nr:hypothetical protein [Legionellaceae bacterium]